MNSMCDPVTLFGSAMAAGVAGPVTAGLIGSGGAFSLATGTLTSGLYSAVASMGAANALGVLSLGTSLYGQQYQANITEANMRRQADIFAYDAKVRDNNALMAEWSAQAEADTFQRRLAVIEGKQSPISAKAGVQINVDSPLMVATYTAAEGQLEYLNILNKGDVQAAASRAGAAGKRSAAEQARINASTVQTAAKIGMVKEAAGTGYSLLRNT